MQAFVIPTCTINDNLFKNNNNSSMHQTKDNDMYYVNITMVITVLTTQQI